MRKIKSGNDPKHHFAGAGKQINFGKGATQWENHFTGDGKMVGIGSQLEKRQDSFEIRAYEHTKSPEKN